MSNAKVIAYIGTYTDDNRSRGIYAFEIDPATGRAAFIDAAPAGVNPTYLAITPDRRFLYAANTIEGEGMVSAFAVDPQTGKLTFLNERPAGGSKPVHVIVESEGRFVFAGNFGNGSVGMLSVGEDGRLAGLADAAQHTGSSVHPTRQQGPRVHSVTADVEQRFVVAAEYGADELIVYGIDRDNRRLRPQAAPLKLAPGSGPRHMAFHPSGRWAYVINELGNTIMSFDYDPANGILSLRETVSALPDDFTGTSHCADILADAAGRYLYGSNRGHDSMVIYRIDRETGALTLVGHEPTRGKSPRSFAVDPSGRIMLVAHQDTDNIAVFKIDSRTGALDWTGRFIEVPVPVCVKMISLGS